MSLGMTGLSIRLPLPTPALVRDANRRFDQERYGRVDPVLRRIFSAHPKNRMFDDVLLKVALLNTLYNTRLLAIVAMADHIHTLRLDGALAAGDPALVEQIACLTIRGKQRRHYSFATKYCSWHQPEQFPIFDNQVASLLLLYKRQWAFSEFNHDSLRNYDAYKAVIRSFQVYFHLDAFAFRQVDKFLWLTKTELDARP